MPTFQRRSFVPQAIKYFLRQSYDSTELIVIDDGPDPVAELIPQDERIRYYRVPAGLTLGAKRNLACQHARGEIIAHWDDDDWYAPHRLDYQVEALLAEDAEVCGLSQLLFYDIEQHRAWHYIYPPDQQPWLAGGTLCYRRTFWETNRFANIDVGEDACFVWTKRPKRLAALPDPNFFVGIVHPKNTSPKETEGSNWHSLAVDNIQEMLGNDWAFYKPDSYRTITVSPNYAQSRVLPEAASPPLRNVFACLVHERQECIVDLVRNLRYHDPSSEIILYDGSRNSHVLNNKSYFEHYGAIVHPKPRPMSWGWLHGFALDTIQLALESCSFDTLTIVDSDQLAVRPGYSDYLREHLLNRPNVGILGNSPDPQHCHTGIGPARQAWREIELWRSFLNRFTLGEEKFVQWTFWPSTVFTFAAARDLWRFFNEDEQLNSILRQSNIWATEEVVLPTVVALLGYEVAENPCSYEYVRYRVDYSIPQLDMALNRSDVFWVHPVPRVYNDPLRKHIREAFNHYERPTDVSEIAVGHDITSSSELLLVLPLLTQMRTIKGWLEEDEADLLISVAARALSLHSAKTIIEVGSYCGRATVVLGAVSQTLSPGSKVVAIESHDGRVGATDQEIIDGPVTLETFKRNITNAGLDEVVRTIQKHSHEVAWDEPVCLLLIDGLHDFSSVACDFQHFEKWVVPHGFVAFHDYADYYPGVQAFVDEILRAGAYRMVKLVNSLMVLEKL
jgi:glycosyltransferase involved in cell wall biosynthesis